MFFRMQKIMLLITLFTATIALPTSADNKYDEAEKRVDVVINLVLEQAAMDGILPDGSLDGPKNTDIMYQMAVTTLGAPVLKATTYFQNDHSGGNPTGYTTIAYYGSFMSGLALIVTALLMLFVAFGGLMNTAADGKFLGEKWNSYYVPLRTGFGISALYPSKAMGGLSLVQVLTIGLALLGIGIASSIFAWVSKSMLSTPLILPNIPSQANVAKAIIDGQLCAFIDQHYHDGEGPQLVEKKVSALRGNASTYTKTILSFSKGDCGGMAIKQHTIDNSSMDYAINKVIGIAASDVAIDSLKVLYNDLLPVSYALSMMASAAGAYPNVSLNFIVDDDFTTTGGDLAYDLIAKEFAGHLAMHELRLRNVLINGEIQGLLEKSNDALIDDASRLGFIMAGTFYYTWARTQDQLNELVENNVPELISPEVPIVHALKFSLNGYAEELSRVKLRAEKMFKSVYKADGLGDSISAHVGSQQNVLGEALSQMSAGIAKGLTSPGKAGSSSKLNPDPIMELKSMGNMIMNSYAAILLATAVADAGTNNLFTKVVTLGTSSIPGRMIKTLLELLVAWSFPILAIGFIYANLLPALPYIMWTTAAAGYLIYVIEAVYASPFWMAMHITPEGHELTGKGASGYPILLTLVLRPSFMIGGLLAAMAIVRVLGWFINQTLFDAMRNMGVGTFNISSTFGMIVVYGIALSAIIYKAFSLPHELPNAMLRWMGVGGHHADLGEKEGMDRTVGVMGGVGAYFQSSAKKPAIEDGDGDKGDDKGGDKGGDDKAQSGNQTDASKSKD